MIPETVVVVFEEPATTTALVDTCGATSATPSTCAMASASAIVSVSADPPAPRTKPTCWRRADAEQVGPEALDEVGDPGRRALRNGDQRDDGRHADDHPQHRQERPQPGRRQPREGEGHQLRPVHAASLPSRTLTLRLAATATSLSWVMRTIVRPDRCSSWSSASTSAPDAVVEVPGGLVRQDHRRPVTSARAIATRCCWPPDSSTARGAAGPPSPSRASARGRAAVALVPADARVQQRHGHVLQRARPRQQVERLEDETDRAVADPGELVVGEARHGGPGEPVRAGRRAVQAAEHVHERATSRIPRADDRQELAGGDVEVHALEGLDLQASRAVGLADAAHLDDVRSDGLVRERIRACHGCDPLGAALAPEPPDVPPPAPGPVGNVVTRSLAEAVPVTTDRARR